YDLSGSLLPTNIRSKLESLGDIKFLVRDNDKGSKDITLSYASDLTLNLSELVDLGALPDDIASFIDGDNNTDGTQLMLVPTKFVWIS
ncbi:hypothetical protein, partial [Moorena sp. SIO4A1]|uniref:hypothetical protein n=1 Tax=Moorena sp. SIO4A1 TaxID=2607835 RepID=UPI0025E8A25E